MAKETFVMVSLEEEKSKEIAQVISNKTSRKILEYLGEKEHAHEAKIATDLKLPVSTVHYNIRHLLKSGLIEAKDFRWSEKGKKVELYTVARKLIVIAPKGSEGLKEKLKGLIPVSLIALVGSGALYLYQKFGRLFESGGRVMSAQAEESAVFGAKDAVLREAAPAIAEEIPAVIPEPNYALWFFIGSIFAIALSFVIILIQNYWRSRK
ncbi:MAG: helix-turn-helix domain-containing protein [Candidatus Woesearchaeota archaeon]